MPATRKRRSISDDEELSDVGSKSTPSSGHYRHSQVVAWCLYAADWITVVVVVAVAIIILIPWPLSFRFLVTDTGIQQKYHNDRVSIDRVCVVLNSAIPIVVIMLWMGYHRRRLSEIHQALLGWAMSVSFCTLFTSICKHLGEIPSSDFLDLCQPNPADVAQSLRTGMPLSYQDCQNQDIKHAMHEYPVFSVSISACSMGYLSLFASVQLGLQLHPQVRRQLRAMSPDGHMARSRPGQTLISLISIVPAGAALAFPAIETRYHGGGHAWGYAFSIILGYAFALWGHVLYCYDLSTDL
ncbi:hypothetical protein GGI04_005245, partial [Coemansia thaxteri]